MSSEVTRGETGEAWSNGIKKKKTKTNFVERPSTKRLKSGKTVPNESGWDLEETLNKFAEAWHADLTEEKRGPGPLPGSRRRAHGGRMSDQGTSSQEADRRQRKCTDRKTSEDGTELPSWWQARRVGDKRVVDFL